MRRPIAGDRLTVIAYHLDGKNSKSDLTEFAEQTLAEFDLTATIN
jgi:hypothetical protein